MMRDSKTKGKKTRRPKMKLGLPDPDQAKSAELNSLRSPESQRGYRHSIDEFVAWHCSEPDLSFNKTVVTRYRIHLESRELAPGTINERLVAVPTARRDEMPQRSANSAYLCATDANSCAVGSPYGSKEGRIIPRLGDLSS